MAGSVNPVYAMRKNQFTSALCCCICSTFSSVVDSPAVMRIQHLQVCFMYKNTCHRTESFTFICMRPNWCSPCLTFPLHVAPCLTMSHHASPCLTMSSATAEMQCGISRSSSPVPACSASWKPANLETCIAQIFLRGPNLCSEHLRQVSALCLLPTSHSYGS